MTSIVLFICLVIICVSTTLNAAPASTQDAIGPVIGFIQLLPAAQQIEPTISSNPIESPPVISVLKRIQMIFRMFESFGDIELMNDTDEDEDDDDDDTTGETLSRKRRAGTDNTLSIGPGDITISGGDNGAQ